MVSHGISSLVWPLLLIVGMSVVYAAYVLAAVAISRSRLSKLREDSGAVPERMLLAREVISNPSSHLLGIQLGCLLSAVFTGIGVLASSYSLLEAELGSINLTSKFVLVFGVIALITLAFISVGQAAKALAFGDPEKVVIAISRLVVTNTRIFYPVILIVDGIISPLLGLFGIKVPVEREIAVSPEEITEMVELSAETGEIRRDQREMIAGVFSISDTAVREVMTPRSDLISIRVDATLDEVKDVFRAEGVSRLVVYRESLDDVCGVLIAKDLIQFIGQGAATEFSVAKVMRAPIFVPNSKKTSALLSELRRKGNHFAVVVDEQGGVDGVVTIEDVLEEIVGEILDEFDSPSDEILVTRDRSGELLVDGGMLLDDLHDLNGINLPRGQYDTVGGFVLHQLGHVPDKGEVLELEWLRVVVEDVQANRVNQIRIIPKSIPRAGGQNQKDESINAAPTSNTLGRVVPAELGTAS